MKLSVIVPFHKGKHFLSDCFASLLEQNIKDFETILILDNVKEDIDDLIKEYKVSLNIKEIVLNKIADKIIYSSYLKNENDEMFISNEEFEEISKEERYVGTGAARNAGMDVAQGEYIFFLDSDDYLGHDTLKLLLSYGEENNFDIVYGTRNDTWLQKKAYRAKDESAKDTEEDIKNTDQRLKDIKEINEAILMDSSGNRSQNQINSMSLAYYDLFEKQKYIKGISAIGILLRREFLEKNKIRFPEDRAYFTMQPFMINALINAGNCYYVEEALYIKRKHNDPVYHPSLSQTVSENKFEQLVLSFGESMKILEGHFLRGNLENKIIHYYSDVFSKKIRRSSDNNWRTIYFELMADIADGFDKKLVKELKGYKRRMIKALQQRDIKKTTRYININLGIKKLKAVSNNKKHITYYLYFKVFSKMNVKENWVICESFFGKSYSDNPKYIYEYISKNHPGKYKFIWVINKKTDIPYKHIRVKRFSIRYGYYLARCKYNVFNVRQPKWLKKREENVFLQTWHGTPLKRLVFDQEEVTSAVPLFKAEFYKQSRDWDYLVSANRFSSKVFRSAFRYNKEILEYGYPRNDILCKSNRGELAIEIKEKLGIPRDKKTILYAPTWRDDEYYGSGQYKFQLELDLNLLKEELGDEYAILLRTHHYIADVLDISGYGDFVYNLSKYNDISEIYLISDILITDYSSVFFDFANLKRPILFFTYDLERYRDILRGFYIDIESEVPGPLLFSSNEVVEAIKDIEQIDKEYGNRYNNFYDRFCSLDDGRASERIAKKVFGLQ